MIKTFIYDYQDISFKLFISDFWDTIYRGKPREELYYDYRSMLDFVKYVKKNRYILDIGSNCGIFAVPVSLLGYKVLGFEPVKINIDSLEIARVENNLKDFNMFHAALSNKDEEVDIYVPECHDNASLSAQAAVANMANKTYTTEKVHSFVFDEWIKWNAKFNDIGLIKIDVQGGEVFVLEGMKEYLKDKHGVYLICEFEECHLNTMGHTFDELNNLILSLGFIHISTTSNDRYFYKK